MKYRLAILGVLLSVAATTAAAGQSLAELARLEEERRKAIKTPAKVITNESIGAVSSPPPAPPSSSSPAATAPTAAGPGASAAEPAGRGGAAAANAPAAAAAQKKDEQYWRKRIQAERDALARAQTFAEALQTRINVLSADFVARDDPAQRAVIGADRQKALAELDRLKQEIAQFTKGIAATQDEARRAGVPPGWLR
jgi:hypothetical protein